MLTVEVIGRRLVVHEAVEAIDISLSRSDIEYLEEPYRPVRVSGHGGDWAGRRPLLSPS